MRAQNVEGGSGDLHSMVEVKITPLTVAKLLNLPQTLTYEDKVELRKMNFYLKERIKDTSFMNLETFIMPGAKDLESQLFGE
jgi:hypothetical protein